MFSQVNTEICKQLGISRSVTSAYHPQTNGLDERTNQTLKVRLAKLINEHQDNWDDYLEEIAFSIRTQKQGSTKYSPFFLMFGRHARTPMEVSTKCSVHKPSKMIITASIHKNSFLLIEDGRRFRRGRYQARRSICRRV